MAIWRFKSSPHPLNCFLKNSNQMLGVIMKNTSRRIGLPLFNFDPTQVVSGVTFSVIVKVRGSGKKYIHRRIPIVGLRGCGNSFVGTLVYVTPVYAQHGVHSSKGKKMSRTSVRIDKTPRGVWKLYLPKDWTRKINNPRQFQTEEHF